MSDSKFVNLRPWVEPAHPGVIKLHDDLVAILTLVRDRAQPAIDKAFDTISRRIGFVVTTTVPVVFEVDAGSKIAAVRMGAENLKGTLFEEGFMESLKSVHGQQVGSVAQGRYPAYLIWLGALKLRLPCHWCEPAHVGPEGFRVASEVSLFDFGPIEPAQWFDPGLLLSVEDAVLVHALDQVYPQLRLVDRIGQIRAALRTKVGPHIPEPAHRQMGHE